MRVNKIRARHGYRTRPYAATKPSALIPNLLQRRFTVAKPNQAWVTDITYIRTWQGWLYLAVVMDLFSRKIVGWSTKPTISRELVLDAVMMAARLIVEVAQIVAHERNEPDALAHLRDADILAGEDVAQIHLPRFKADPPIV